MEEDSDYEHRTEKLYRAASEPSLPTIGREAEEDSQKGKHKVKTKRKQSSNDRFKSPDSSRASSQMKSMIILPDFTPDVSINAMGSEMATSLSQSLPDHRGRRRRACETKEVHYCRMKDANRRLQQCHKSPREICCCESRQSSSKQVKAAHRSQMIGQGEKRRASSLKSTSQRRSIKCLQACESCRKHQCNSEYKNQQLTRCRVRDEQRKSHLMIGGKTAYEPQEESNPDVAPVAAGTGSDNEAIGFLNDTEAAMVDTLGLTHPFLSQAHSESLKREFLISEERFAEHNSTVTDTQRSHSRSPQKLRTSLKRGELSPEHKERKTKLARSRLSEEQTLVRTISSQKLSPESRISRIERSKSMSMSPESKRSREEEDPKLKFSSHMLLLEKSSETINNDATMLIDLHSSQKMRTVQCTKGGREKSKSAELGSSSSSKPVAQPKEFSSSVSSERLNRGGSKQSVSSQKRLTTESREEFQTSALQRSSHSMNDISHEADDSSVAAVLEIAEEKAQIEDSGSEAEHAKDELELSKKSKEHSAAHISITVTQGEKSDVSDSERIIHRRRQTALPSKALREKLAIEDEEEEEKGTRESKIERQESEDKVTDTDSHGMSGASSGRTNSRTMSGRSSSPCVESDDRLSPISPCREAPKHQAAVGGSATTFVPTQSSTSLIEMAQSIEGCEVYSSEEECGSAPDVSSTLLDDVIDLSGSDTTLSAQLKRSNASMRRSFASRRLTADQVGVSERLVGIKPTSRRSQPSSEQGVDFLETTQDPNKRIEGRESRDSAKSRETEKAISKTSLRGASSDFKKSIRISPGPSEPKPLSPLRDLAEPSSSILKVRNPSTRTPSPTEDEDLTSNQLDSTEGRTTSRKSKTQSTTSSQDQPLYQTGMKTEGTLRSEDSTTISELVTDSEEINATQICGCKCCEKTCHCCASCPCSNKRKPEDVPFWFECDTPCGAHPDKKVNIMQGSQSLQGHEPQLSRKNKISHRIRNSPVTSEHYSRSDGQDLVGRRTDLKNRLHVVDSRTKLLTRSGRMTTAGSPCLSPPPTGTNSGVNKEDSSLVRHRKCRDVVEQLDVAEVTRRESSVQSAMIGRQRKCDSLGRQSAHVSQPHNEFEGSGPSGIRERDEEHAPFSPCTNNEPTPLPLKLPSTRSETTQTEPIRDQYDSGNRQHPCSDKASQTHAWSSDYMARANRHNSCCSRQRRRTRRSQSPHDAHCKTHVCNCWSDFDQHNLDIDEACQEPIQRRSYRPSDSWEELNSYEQDGNMACQRACDARCSADDSCSTDLSDDEDWNMVAVRPAARVRCPTRSNPMHGFRMKRCVKTRYKYPLREEDGRQRSEGLAENSQVVKKKSSTIQEGSSDLSSSDIETSSRNREMSGENSLIVLPPLDDDEYASYGLRLPRTPDDKRMDPPVAKIGEKGSPQNDDKEGLADLKPSIKPPSTENHGSKVESKISERSLKDEQSIRECDPAVEDSKPSSKFLIRFEDENEPKLPIVPFDSRVPLKPESSYVIMASVYSGVEMNRMAGSAVKSPSLRSASQSPSDRAYNLPGAGGSTVTNVHTKKYECGCQEIVREYTTTIDGGCGKEACPCGCADVDSGMNRLSSTMVIQPSQDPSLKRAGSVCCCDTQQIIHCPDEKPCDCGDGCNCETMWAKRVDYAQNEPFESGPPASHDTRLHCPDEKACDCNFNCDCPTVWRSLQPTTDKEDSPLKPTLLTPRSPTGKLHCPDEKPCDCPFQCDCPVKWQQVKSTTCPTDKDCDCSPCSPNELPERNCECIAWEETVHKDTQTTFNLKKRSRTVECEPATSETFDEPKPIFDLSQDDGSTTCRVYPYRRHTTGTSEPVTTSASQYTGDSTTVCDSEEEPGCCWKFWCCGRKKRKKIGEARSESSKSSRKYEKERRKREKREKKMARMKERKGKKKKERKHKKKKEKKRRRKKKKTNDSEC